MILSASLKAANDDLHAANESLLVSRTGEGVDDKSQGDVGYKKDVVFELEEKRNLIASELEQHRKKKKKEEKEEEENDNVIVDKNSAAHSVGCFLGEGGGRGSHISRILNLES